MASEELDTNQLLKKNRISIYQYYNDKFGKRTKDLINAYEQEFLVSYEEYMESRTEEFEEEEDFGNGKKSIVSIFGNNGVDYISSDFIYPNNFRDLSSIILNKLNVNIKHFSLKISFGNKLIEFTQELIENIFSKFRNIKIDLANSDSWITMPSEINIDTLIIKNTNIIFNNSDYIIEDSCYFDKCVFKSINSEIIPMVHIETLHKGNLSNIYISEPMYIVFIGKYFMNKIDIFKSEINISNINILFSQNSFNSDEKYKSVITVGQAYNIAISDIISLEDIPYFPLLSVINSSECFITNIDRKFNEIEARTHTIELKAISNTEISDIKYLSTIKNDKSYFKINNMDSNSNISIINFKIAGSDMFNFSGIKINELSLMDGYCSSKKFELSGMSRINKLIIDNVEFNVDSFILDTFSTNISDSNIKSTNNIKLINNESYNIINTDFNCSESLYEIFRYNDSVFNIRDSHLTTKTNIIQLDKETIIKDKSIKNVFKADGTVFVGNILAKDIYNININDCLLDSLDSISFDSIESLNLNSSINYKSAPIDFIATNIHFYNTVYKISNMSKNVKLKFVNCTGSFNVEYEKYCPKEYDTTLYLFDSALLINTISLIKRIIKIFSSDNKGSVIIGRSKSVISLDMSSKDISLFEYTDNPLSVSSTQDKIYYGYIN